MKEGIASNLLADRLAKLVRAGILTKLDHGRGRSVDYRLAEPGIQLVPALAVIGAWGAQFGGLPIGSADGAVALMSAGPAHWDEAMSALRRRDIRAADALTH